jgi:dynein heavy chain
MDDVIKYVLVDSKPILPVREEGLFVSCLSLLGAMLSENNNISGEMHIERLYLYCLIWTFGGVLEPYDQKGFSDLLNKLVSSLPDDDLKSSVFEYYVDESGEWDLWSAKVPETQYLDNMDLLGNLFVETTETIRCKVFLELANLANLNVVMIGSSGCGKTTLIQDFIQDLGKF